MHGLKFGRGKTPVYENQRGPKPAHVHVGMHGHSQVPGRHNAWALGLGAEHGAHM